jgi:hypothetical protein
MSYRVHIGKIKKKDLDNHLSKTVTDSDEDYDEKWDFFYNSRETELFDETPIEQFKIIKGYENEEYPPYVLTKKDFQRLLNFYKNFLKDSFEEKEKQYDKIKSKNDIDLRTIVNNNIHFYYLKNYFKNLIKQNKNITESGLFLLDYFYLVNMYNSWKNGERAVITHG